MHAIEACIFKYDVNKKKSQKKKNRSRNLNSVPHGPSKNTISGAVVAAVAIQIS